MKTLLIPAIFAATLAAQRLDTPAQSPLGAAPPLDKVVATVDGKDITYGELVSILSMYPPQTQANPLQALQNAFIMRYLAAEGDKIRLGEQSPLKEEIEFQRMNIVAGAMLNRHRDQAAVGPGTIESYYNANKSNYQQGKVKAIYIGFKPVVNEAVQTQEELAQAAQAALAQAHAATNRTEAQSKSLAEEIVKKARGGADFSALADQYSEDPASKAAHGDLGVIKHDSLAYPEDFKKAVFALDNGKVSDPLRVGNGFFIVRMEERSIQPLSEVQAEILHSLKQGDLDQWFRDLTNRFKPEIKDPAAFVRSGMPGISQPAK